MLREQCVSDDVDMQALLDGDQRNGNGRKRNRGAFDPGTNSKKTRGAAADADDERVSTTPVFCQSVSTVMYMYNVAACKCL